MPKRVVGHPSFNSQMTQHSNQVDDSSDGEPGDEIPAPKPLSNVAQLVRKIRERMGQRKISELEEQSLPV